MRQEDACKKCHKSFKSRKSYLDHVSYGHTVQCYYCGEYFWNSSQRDNHIQAKHKRKTTPTATVSKAPNEGNPAQVTTSAGAQGPTPLVEQKIQLNLLQDISMNQWKHLNLKVVLMTLCPVRDPIVE